MEWINIDHDRISVENTFVRKTGSVVKFSFFGGLGGLGVGICYWLAAALLNRIFYPSTLGIIFSTWTVLLLFFPLALLIPKHTTAWNPELAILSGFFAGWGLFVIAAISNTLRSMKYEFLQVNDWTAYVQGGVIAYGVPLAFAGVGIAFVMAKVHNRKIEGVAT